MAEKISVIVKFKDIVTQENMNFVSAQDAEIKNVYKSINAISANVPKDKIGKLKINPNVEYVEIDQEAHILGFPTDPVPLRSFKVATEQIIPWGIQKIRTTEVWPNGNKGTGIKVCIIDTGIDYDHEDLAGNYKGGYNFINNSNNPKDDHGHGTHVSGTIAALDNNVGVIGVAPESHIYAIKVLDANGSGSYSNIIAGIQWAIDNKMQIISMSLGGTGYSKTLEDICDKAYKEGLLIIAAAGNRGSDGDTITYPAKFDSVIAVGATDSNDERASFSSVGPDLELSAPGVKVLSTVPKGSCKMCDPSGYREANGTSMACPHTSGTAALIIKAYPELRIVDVRKVLQETTVDLGNQGRDIYYGYGRIDAKAAVDKTPPPPPPPGKRYKCTGAPDYQCVEDPNGPYGSLEECQSKCKPIPPEEKKYKCRPAIVYRCVEHKHGKYTLEECQKICEERNKSLDE